MDSSRLVEALARAIPRELADNMVEAFMSMRQDLATRTLGRSSPGKFVETLVQALEHIESGKHSSQPKVDEYLRSLESRASPLDEGLRCCAARIGRAMYTLRNKRSIAHVGTVDPNIYDLRFLYAGAQWIISELIRVTSGIPVEEAGRLAEFVSIPVNDLVQDVGSRRIVLEDLPLKEEILVLLHSFYPDPVQYSTIVSSLGRQRRSTVSPALASLRARKLVDSPGKGLWVLTRRGYDRAVTVINECIQAQRTGG